MVQPKMIGSTYLPLPKDPTSQYRKELVTLVKKGKDNKILNKKRSPIFGSGCMQITNYLYPTEDA
ncbi:unnamed protein product [Staurois parvus]|uniref:Uncharacterized protein n=1 Tax=Staurois parvus TaxID=386267 RepID=A0ABN9CA72_9NEOB|nr:unnamed protein product [Staurois parvus]